MHVLNPRRQAGDVPPYGSLDQVASEGMLPEAEPFQQHPPPIQQQQQQHMHMQGEGSDKGPLGVHLVGTKRVRSLAGAQDHQGMVDGMDVEEF